MTDAFGSRNEAEQAPQVFIVTSAIARKGREVLLVEERVDSGKIGWSLPGGVVEVRESIITALSREIAEETGLSVTKNHGMAYAVQSLEGANTTLAFVFDVSVEGVIHITDPDKEILSACFFSIPEAIERLRLFPIKVMVEPAIAYFIR